MSHFAVLVVMDEEPTKDSLHRVLLPWHEYECTGYTEFTQWIDHTAEVTAEYAALSAEDRTKYPTLKRYAKEWHGYEVRPDGSIGHVTNPNRKWDWWQIGGRYSGKLLVRERALALTGERSWTNEDAAIAGYDAARRSDLDLDAMKRQAQDWRREWAEECCLKAKRPISDLDIACRLAPIVHAQWIALTEPRPRGGEYSAWVESQGGEWPVLAAFNRACFELPQPSPNQSVADWIEAAPPISTWSVVMDGQWFEKGKMGWWGISSGDKADWEDRFNDLFGLIHDDQWIAVVDCHI